MHVVPFSFIYFSVYRIIDSILSTILQLWSYNSPWFTKYVIFYRVVILKWFKIINRYFCKTSTYSFRYNVRTSLDNGRSGEVMCDRHGLYQSTRHVYLTKKNLYKQKIFCFQLNALNTVNNCIVKKINFIITNELMMYIALLYRVFLRGRRRIDKHRRKHSSMQFFKVVRILNWFAIQILVSRTKEILFSYTVCTVANYVNSWIKHPHYPDSLEMLSIIGEVTPLTLPFLQPILRIIIRSPNFVFNLFNLWLFWRMS